LSDQRINVGVIGCGLIAQAVHLPNLARMPDRFRIAAVADPRPDVRAVMAERHPGATAYASGAELIAAGELDTVIICTPPADHADTACAALAAGFHVFCEKPLTITLADADRVIAAGKASGRVVQVGYMKRHDPAYRRMRDELPDSASRLRYVSVEAHDPEAGPYFASDEIARGPIDPELVARESEREREQVRLAVGRSDDVAVRAFCDGYLGSLVHFVNVVHGLLERMGEPLPAAVEHSAWWAGGAGLTAAVRLAGGARWDSAWIQLLDLQEHRERVALLFEDGISTLELGSPWLRRSAANYERSWAEQGGRRSSGFRSHTDPFTLELEAFHASITTGAECLTPPEQARVDIDALTRMFVSAEGDRAE
jgi:predicted dehydrogenase